MTLRRFWIDAIFFVLLFAYVVLFCIAPAHAATVAAAAPVSTAVYLSPFLTVLVQALGAIVLAVIAYYTPRLLDAATAHFNIKVDDTVRSALVGLFQNAAHFGLNYFDQKVTRVGAIDVGNPQVAAAANWALVHASDEISHANLSDQEVIESVQAAIAQVQHQLSAPASTTKGSTT